MSTKPRIYLDFNASAPLIAEARDSMAGAMALVGNPSSIHAEGRAVRDRVESARNAVAALVERPRDHIVFTSGGTEANHLGVLGLAAVAERRGLPRVVATTPIEHPSLRGAVDALAARGWTVRRLAVDGDGRIQLPELAPLGLLALSAVNHELGTMFDLEELDWARHAGALIHVDAVQAVGKTTFGGNYPDSLAISAHKLGGPQGIGALAIAIDDGLPIVDGGHQERGRRAGTENVVGIVGFGAAAAAADPLTWPRVAALGDRLEMGLLAIDGVRVHGATARRIGGTVNAGFAGALGESIVIALDLAGVAVSTGAACTSGSVQPSPVLLGIGMPAERAREAVRFSLGRSTTEAEIDEVLRVLPGILERARRR